jgi:hypothetical protein
VIQRNDQTGATAAAPERTSRRERRERPASPVISAPVRSDDPGIPDAMLVAPASTVAVPSTETAPAARPVPVPRRVAPDGLGYRAVFACVRDAGSRTE